MVIICNFPEHSDHPHFPSEFWRDSSTLLVSTCLGQRPLVVYFVRVAVSVSVAHPCSYACKMYYVYRQVYTVLESYRTTSLYFSAVLFLMCRAVPRIFFLGSVRVPFDCMVFTFIVFSAERRLGNGPFQALGPCSGCLSLSLSRVAPSHVVLAPCVKK